MSDLHFHMIAGALSYSVVGVIIFRTRRMMRRTKRSFADGVEGKEGHQ